MLEFLAWPPPEDDVDLADWQDDRCAFCGIRPWNGTVLDHDHTTGMTRGYLCQRCNLREARAMTEEWERWREGCNPAVMYGRSVLYISPFGRVPVIDPPPLSEEERERLFAQILAALPPFPPRAHTPSHE